MGDGRSVRDAFEAVPRSLFVPEVIWFRREDGWFVPLRRQDDPDRWQEACRADDPIVTQVDEGRAAGKGFWATSSSSTPSLMARMLEALQLGPGMRVLEIGTGTGFNAALLAYIAGTQNVTSIEIDVGLATRAREALARAGRPVRVVAGDGLRGHPQGAPYDRLIATAAVREVPYAWVEQVRPGGLIVTPWTLTIHPEAPFGVLRVGDDGTAEGRFVGPSGFMSVRGQRGSQQEVRRIDRAWIRAGEPDVARYGVTVTREGQAVWLDEPGHRVG
ncbi:rRNA adenine N-6-methyltransferase family protein [Actinomadura violacea]|uniref:Protein-L-isoaspartate O-methyltransferase n=1 Tax=Actinomadura violacea TaxID=2819934 RepID=A0ABS3S7I0_9ACTN|nr:rRNA adenine N-6-methyltransferase family protein [Actinomadura violacea]MBO2464199.1 protein-L-isoaspartate(D-aspartate) O-methyltransferase [Actinomadura violacea]